MEDEMRKTGRTTRLINACVEDVLISMKFNDSITISVSDHYKSIRSNQLFASTISMRLTSEHGLSCRIVECCRDYAKISISKTKKNK